MWYKDKNPGRLAGLRGTGPHRLARPRTSASQAEDTGSNPVGAAIIVRSQDRNGLRDACERDKRGFSDADKGPTGTLSRFFSADWWCPNLKDFADFEGRFRRCQSAESRFSNLRNQRIRIVPADSSAVPDVAGVLYSVVILGSVFILMISQIQKQISPMTQSA